MKTLNIESRDTYAHWIDKIISKNFDLVLFIASGNRELFDIDYNLNFFLRSENKSIFHRAIMPEMDCDFYDQSPPSKNIIFSRIKGLSLLISDKRKIIITTPAAMMPRTIPIDLFFDNILNIKIGQKINISAFSSQLINLGYIRSEKVFSFGEYAIRGDIIDIACLDENQAIRLNVDGDIVDGIKQFEISSQLSNKTDISEASVLPCDEVIINDQSLSLFKKNISKKPQNIFTESISSGIKTSDYINYLPFFYDKTSSFLEYASWNKKILVILSHGSLEIIKDMDKKIIKSYEAAMQNKKSAAYPEPELLYTNSGKIIDFINKAESVTLNVSNQL